MTTFNKMKILVTQSGFKHSLGLMRHLAQLGHEVYGLAPPTATRRFIARQSRYPKAIYPLDQNSEAEFVRQLIDLQAKAQFDVLIPVGFPVTEFVSRYADALLAHIKFVATPIQQLELAEDKLRVAQRCQELGVPSPQTLQVQSLDALSSIAQQITYPIVIKGRKESAKGIVDYAHSADELVVKFGTMCQKFELTDPTQHPILQEYVAGHGAGFFALYDHGEIKRMFMHRRIREYPPSGGPSCCAESFYDERLLDTGKRLLDGLKWHGIAMVECRFDPVENNYKVIEINPKFWGSLELALAAGADFVSDYVKLATGQSLTYNDAYKNIRFQWVLDGDLSHAIKRKEARGAFLKDLINPKVQKDIRLDDVRVTLLKMLLFIMNLRHL